MSASANLPIAGRRARPALVIDGEATVVSRKSTHRPAETAPDPIADASAAMPFDLHPKAEARATFGRRSSGRRRSAPDLVFQGDAWKALEPAAAKPARRGLSVFSDAARLGAPRDRRMAGLAAVAALLALPLLILSAPIAPAEATPGAEPFVVDEVVSSIVPRGSGAVLTVEARIRNVSGALAAVPPVRIALVEAEGRLRTKSLLPGVAALAAGRSVRFHSTIAVAKDTEGGIEVGFLAPKSPSGKTFIE